MPKKETVSLAFEPAKNGLISRHTMRTKRSGQGGGPDFDHETETTVHPTMAHAQGHLKELLAHMFTHQKEEMAEIKAEKKGGKAEPADAEDN